MRLARLPIVACLLVAASLLGCRSQPPSRLLAPTSIGSLKNAKVAIERPDPHHQLVYFAREVSPEQAAELATLAPHLTVVSGLTREEAERRAAEAAGADAYYATPAFLKAATQLRWLQAQSAGVDRIVGMPELKARPEIVLTNMRAVHGPVIAEHSFAMLLALTRELPQALEDEKAERWDRHDGGRERVTLEGRTLLVVGLGGIGTEIAARGNAFGMRVIAIRRGDDPGPDYVEELGKAKDLHAMLAEADVVAIAVPLTDETRGMFDAAAFAAMKRGSYLINIARGQVVVTDALVAALRDGRLAGAGLDVTDPEPLPKGHPLWTAPNVIITPHVAADGALTEERAWIVFRENLRRFESGEPLLNTVSIAAGY